MIKGIDLSTWQANVDYMKVKNDNIDFAIIRDGYGRNKTQKDNQFENHYSGLKYVGIPIGAYHYAYASDIEGAKKEAKMCLEFIKEKDFDLPIFYDIEDSKIKADKETLTKMCQAFCDILIENGYKAGVYANLDWFTNRVNVKELEKYYIWLAQWNDKITASFKVDFWQYTSKGEVNGIKGNVDLNTRVINEQNNGKPNKTIEELAKEVIEGKWGNGRERYENLTLAGYDYNKVQAKVNEILGYKTKNYYIVKRGDTLYKIAKMYNTTIDKLARINHLGNPNYIVVGQKLLLD